MSKQPLKIVILSHISDLVGGAEMSMMDIFDYWDKHHQIKPEFIIRKPVGTLATALKARGWKYHALDYSFWSNSAPLTEPEEIFQEAFKNTKAIAEIQKILEKVKPDIVMTNSVVSPWAAIAAYYERLPHLWFVREYGDLDHGRTYELGREKTYEDVDSTSAIVAANSSTLAEYLRQYIDPSKVTAVYTPFDIKALQQKAAQPTSSPFKDSRALKLVIIGNLAPSKGQLEVIHAASRLNKAGYNTEVCIVGGKASKEFMTEITSVIARQKLKSKVHLLGFQKNPLSYANFADVCIMASGMEAFGRVTFEYLALGKPVVGTNSGATPEMVKEGINGYLYESRDTQSLYNALLHYAKDQSLAARHGNASLRQAETMMKSELNAEALFKKIEKLIENLPKDMKQTPLNYDRNLAKYLAAADEHMKKFGSTSVKKLIQRRVRSKAGRYIRAVKQKGRRLLKK